MDRTMLTAEYRFFSFTYYFSKAFFGLAENERVHS